MTRRATILLVEDNLGDVDLVKESLQDSPLIKDFYVARDGMKALAMLRKEGEYAGFATPDLILLDLNLPKMDGRELLADIKRDPALKRIPVIVLTTSNASTDVSKCYELNANCYILKPCDFNSLAETLGLIEKYWLQIVCLPQS